MAYRLAPVQRRAVTDEGITVLADVIPLELCRQLVAEAWAAPEQGTVGDSWFSDLQMPVARLVVPSLAGLDLLVAPRVLMPVVELLGTNVYAAEVWVACLEQNVDGSSGSSATALHRDADPILRELSGALIPRLSMTVLWALGDIDLRWTWLANSHQSKIEDPAAIKRTLDIVVPVGSALVYDTRLAHAAPRLARAGRGCFVRVTYAPRWLRGASPNDWRHSMRIDNPILAQLVDVPGFSRFSSIGVSNRFNPFDQALPLADAFAGVLIERVST